MFEDDDAEILEDPLVRRCARAHALSCPHRALVRFAARYAALTAALLFSEQGMGWLNQSSLTLSKQRPVGRQRKRRGIFIGVSRAVLRRSRAHLTWLPAPCLHTASRKAVPLKPGATVTQRAVRRRGLAADAAAAAAAAAEPPPAVVQAAAPSLRDRVLPSSDAFDPVAYLTTVHKARRPRQIALSAKRLTLTLRFPSGHVAG